MHRGVFGQDQREPGAGAAAGPDHRAGAVGRVAAHQDLPGGSGGAGGGDAWATIRAAPLPEPGLPARSRIPAITGAAVSVLIVAASGDRPLRSTCLPAILVCP